MPHNQSRTPTTPSTIVPQQLRLAWRHPPATQPPNRHPPSRFRIRPGAIGRGIRETWNGVVRVLRLVWASSRLLTIGLGTTNILQSVVPVLQVWLAGQLIDEVVAGFESNGADEHIRGVVILALIQLGIFVGSSLLQAVGNVSQQLLQERLSIHVQLQIMDHANTLDLADFENAT